MSDFYKINTYSFVYNIYFVLVFSLFISTISIIPIFFSLTLQLLGVLSIFLIFSFMIKDGFFKYSDLLIWIFFSIPVILSQLYNVNDVNFTRFFLLILVYPILFFSLRYICSIYSVSRVVKPFVFSVAIIVFLSLIKILGIYEFQIYSSNSESLDNYADIQSRDRLVAITGVFLNQNTFAPILMVGFFSTLIYYFYENKNKILAITLLILNGGLLLLTVARAPIFSLALGLFVFLFLSNLTIKFKFFVTSLISILILLFFYIGDYSKILIDKMDSAGLSYRDVIWNDAFNKFNNEYLFGIGLGNYSFYDGINTYSTHNLYLLFLVCLGTIGSISLFFVLITFLKKIFETFIYYRLDKINLLCACAVLSCFIHQCFEVILDNPLKPFAIFFLFVIAYLYRDQNKLKGGFS